MEGGEGPQEAALEKVLLIVEGVELLLGLCAGGVQPLGEFAADAAQGLQLGLDRPGRFGPLLRRALGPSSEGHTGRSAKPP